MSNIVDFRSDRSRSRHFGPPPSDGARILFFTGVRYEREVELDPPSFVPEAIPFESCETQAALAGAARSDVALDLAAH